MKIKEWDMVNFDEISAIYNDQVAGVPYCYPVPADEFENGFAYRKFTSDRYREDIHSEKVIIGFYDGDPAGFADVAIAEVEEEGCKQHRGFIRFLGYLSGCRPVGQTLLEEAERYLADFGVDKISAFRLNFRYDHGGYRFYHYNYGMISDKMGHICALFHMNGYKLNGGEMFMSQPEYNIPKPARPDKRTEIVVEHRPPYRAVLPGLDVRAFHKGKEIGICESVSAGEFSLVQESQDWLFISGLHVIESEQGKGWGRYLLQRNLWEMQKIGYKNAVISTDWRNYRAQLFYTNYGYRLVDTSYEFVKNI